MSTVSAVRPEGAEADWRFSVFDWRVVAGRDWVLAARHARGPLAGRALKKADEYGPERAKDPQFEEQIRQLREFVQRAHSGERIVTRPETIP